MHGRDQIKNQAKVNNALTHLVENKCLLCLCHGLHTEFNTIKYKTIKFLTFREQF